MKPVADRATWAIDDSNLAAFRIGLALLLIVDWLDRWNLRYLLLAQEGLIPASIGLEKGGVVTRLHLFYFAQSDPWLSALLLLGLLFYFSFLVGYRTNLSCLACLLFYASLLAQSRGTRNFSDDVISLCLLWGCFAGLGACFSLDALAARGSYRSVIGSQVLYLQGLLVVLGAGLAKTGNTWIQGSALEFALRSPLVSNSLGQSIANNIPPGILCFATWISLAIELLAPVILLSPLRGKVFGKVSLACLAALWVGIAVFMSIGLAPWLMLLLLVLYLKPSTLRGIFPQAKACALRSSGLTIIQVPLAFLALLMFSTFVVKTQSNQKDTALSSTLLIPFYLMRASQEWTMFAPDAPTSAQWPVITANLKGGQRIDVLTGQSPDYSHIRLPSPLPRLLRKYFGFVLRDENKFARHILLGRLCAQPQLFQPIAGEVASVDFQILNVPTKLRNAELASPQVTDKEHFDCNLMDQKETTI